MDADRIEQQKYELMIYMEVKQNLLRFWQGQVRSRRLSYRMDLVFLSIYVAIGLFYIVRALWEWDPWQLLIAAIWASFAGVFWWIGTKAKRLVADAQEKVDEHIADLDSTRERYDKLA